MQLRRSAWDRFRRDRASVAALGMLLLVATLSATAPVLAAGVLHTDPDLFVRTDAGRIATLRSPSQGNLLGTDDLGRDVLTRLLYAGRVSLLVGFGVALMSVAIGAPLGLLAAYFGGWFDDSVNALVQVVLNVPLLFVLIVLSVLLAPGALQLALIFGLFLWPSTARQVRGAALSVSRRDYVDAARVLGASHVRVLRQHIAPNVASVVLVMAGIDMATAILAESSLSFLGFGVPVPLASWGNMLTEAQGYMFRNPWLAVYPGLVIFLTVLAINFLGDALRDALDPRSRG